MTRARPATRPATAADTAQLLALWALVYESSGTTWLEHARRWFAVAVEDRSVACFPVVEVDGEVVATAIGTLELGVPNPHCCRGRTVRLANVITRPDHRGRGHGTLLVREVIAWARSIDADRVDLSATPDGQRLYERVGFGPTRAPRMKLIL